MKKFTRLTALVLTAAMLLLTTGCMSKTYASAEEWYLDNPGLSDSMQAMSTGSNGASIEFDIKGNDVIYRYRFNQVLFGQNEATDQLLKSALDKDIESQREVFTNIIDMVSKDSGVDASLISVRLEYYNQGADSPGHTQTITK